jgi:iron complex outermembrane receptor protein
MAILSEPGLRRNCESWETAFDVNLNGNNLLDKSYIAHLSRLRMAFQILEETWFWVNFNL